MLLLLLWRLLRPKLRAIRLLGRRLPLLTSLLVGVHLHKSGWGKGPEPRSAGWTAALVCFTSPTVAACTSETVSRTQLLSLLE